MRRAGYDSDVINIPVIQDGEEMIPVGVSLASDRCSEHEQGIEGIQDTLGIHPYALHRPLGIDAWVMDTEQFNPHNAVWFDDGLDCGLMVENGFSYRMQRFVAEGIPLKGMLSDGSIVGPNEVGRLPDNVRILFMNRTPDIYPIKDIFPARLEVQENGRYSSRKPRNKAEKALLVEQTKGVRGAWDSRGFAVIGRGEEARNALKSLRDALMAGRLTVGMGGNGGNPFARGGVSIMDRALLPEYFVEDTRETDRQHRELQAAFEATGIEKTLRDAGKYYHALRPEWVKPYDGSGLEDIVGEKEQMVFLLNPEEWKNKDGANYGRFTLHELEEWVQGIQGAVLDRRDSTSKKESYPDVQERLRMQVDPDGYHSAVEAARSAGVDMDWTTVRDHAFALRAITVDNPETNDVLLWLNPHEQSEHRRGWFTPEEIVSWMNGQPSAVDLTAGEQEDIKAKRTVQAYDEYSRSKEDAIEASRLVVSAPGPR